MPAKLKVFLSHNSADKPEVEHLYFRLRDEPDIEPWLDKWNLTPGQPWQDELEKAIREADSCAIFIGRGDPDKGVFGPWQHAEMRALISRQVAERGSRFPVIPVLLPGAERAPRSAYPTFLVANTWAEFRHSLDDPEAWQRLLCGIRRQPSVPPAGAAFPAGENPYRGLEFFDVAHAHLFFGRDAVTDWLVSDVRKTLRPHANVPRFLAILGSSGSGKSSVARAGLYASLQQGAIEGSRDWLFVPPFRPGGNPLESLELAVLAAAAGHPALPVVREELKELAARPGALHRAARLLVPDAAPTRRLFLLVDQFEEVFTQGASDQERRAFFAALLHAAREPDGPVVVAVTMRADFYPRVAAHEELARVIAGQQHLLGPMSDAELRQAIAEPARRAGAEFCEGLVDTLVEHARRQPGSLPLLEFALRGLWQRREDGRWLTPEAYRDIGGLEGALRRRADEVFAGLSAKQQELCRRLFLRLVHPGEGAEDTRRRVRLRELEALGDAGLPGLIQALTAKDARLIVTEGAAAAAGGEGTVEVAHEALIRSWPRLRAWLDADREGLKTHRRLTDAAQEWDAHGRAAGFLLAGGRLATALDWAVAHDAELTAVERGFLTESRSTRDNEEREDLRQAQELAEARETARREAEQRRAEAENQSGLLQHRQQLLKMTVVALVLLIIGINAVVWWAIGEREMARRNATLSQAQALLAEARGAKPNNPVRALILAAAAIETTRRHLPGASVLPTAELTLWEALNETGGQPLIGHQGAVLTVAISSDGRWLATGSSDCTVRLWDLQSGSQPSLKHILQGHTDAINTVAISQDGKWLATGSRDHTVRLWDLLTLDPKATSRVCQVHDGGVVALAISPDNRWLMSGGVDGIVKVMDLMAADSTPRLQLLSGHNDVVSTVAISQDGKWMATGSRDRTVRLWDLQAESSISETSVFDVGAGVTAVSFSSDGRRLMVGDDSGIVQAHDLQARTSLQELKAYRHPSARITSLSSSPDRQWLIASGLDNVVVMWNLMSDKQEDASRMLNGHSEYVTSVAVSQDGMWLATGSEDKTARLWNLQADRDAEKERLRRLSWMEANGMDVFVEALHIDGHWANPVKWIQFSKRRLNLEDLLAFARRIAGRNLSTNEWQTYMPGQPYFEVFPGAYIPPD